MNNEYAATDYEVASGANYEGASAGYENPSIETQNGGKRRLSAGWMSAGLLVAGASAIGLAAVLVPHQQNPSWDSPEGQAQIQQAQVQDRKLNHAAFAAVAAKVGPGVDIQSFTILAGTDNTHLSEIAHGLDFRNKSTVDVPVYCTLDQKQQVNCSLGWDSPAGQTQIEQQMVRDKKLHDGEIGALRGAVDTSFVDIQSFTVLPGTDDYNRVEIAHGYDLRDGSNVDMPVKCTLDMKDKASCTVGKITVTPRKQLTPS